MINIRRWYIYLVAAITVQSVTWALIALLRKLFLGQTADLTGIAFQLSVIVVGLPLFLAHWIWGQRRAAKEADEQASFPRRFYLYGMLVAFLAPAVNNGYHALRSLARLIFDVRPVSEYSWVTLPSNSETLISSLIALVVLAVFWGYHWRVKRNDDRLLRESDASVTLRQLYGYGFSAVGLTMTAIGAGQLVEWLFAQILGGRAAVGPTSQLMVSELVRVVLGLGIWLLFWLRAQRAFAGPDEREQESVVRKAYLYLVVFVGALGVIGTATVLLADVFERLFDLSTGAGESGLHTALAIIIVCGSIWAYHAFVIRRDAEAAEEAGRQALVKRIYTYLMAGLALAAFLTGLAGTLTVLFRETDVRSFGTGIIDTMPTFLALLIVGLVVWWWHWRRASQEVTQPPPAGLEERRSFVRRFYLYFYIFAATLTILGSVIYIISQLLMLILGARTSAGFFLDISQALSYTAIAVAIWIYHGRMLRQDGRAVQTAELAQLKKLNVAVVDAGDGIVGRTLADQLHEKAPGAIIHPIGLTETAVAAMQADGDEKTPLELLTEAEVIVGPWSMAVPNGHGGIVSLDLATAITASPAQKILYPEPESGYVWTGVEKWKIEDIAKEVTANVRALTLGEKPASQRRLAPWAIVLIVLVSLCVLTTVVPMLLYLFI